MTSWLACVCVWFVCRYCCTHQQRPYSRAAWHNTCTVAAGQQNNNNAQTKITHTKAMNERISKRADFFLFKLTFVVAAEVEPLFSGTPHQQTPRFFRGSGGRIPPCRCHPPPQWISPDGAERWSLNVPCWRPPNPGKSFVRWWPTFSSSDTRILGPPAGL